MTDSDLFDLLGRAQRTVLILGAILAVGCAIKAGWQSGLLALVGAGISWSGIREWRTLSRALFAQMDNQAPAGTTRRTLVSFFLRLGVVGVVLYVSLRCLNGSVYALVAGIGLAVLALSFEALKQLRG